MESNKKAPLNPVDLTPEFVRYNRAHISYYGAEDASIDDITRAHDLDSEMERALDEGNFRRVAQLFAERATINTISKPFEQMEKDREIFLEEISQLMADPTKENTVPDCCFFVLQLEDDTVAHVVLLGARPFNEVIN